MYIVYTLYNENYFLREKKNIYVRIISPITPPHSYIPSVWSVLLDQAAIDISVCVRFLFDEYEGGVGENASGHDCIIKHEGEGLAVLGRVSVRCQSLPILRQHAI